MKHLKRFNEERLSPEIYKRAGKTLKDIGKLKRGSKLIDYHDELTSDFYTIGSTSTSSESTLTRMKTNFYYGDIFNIDRSILSSNGTDYSKIKNYNVEDLVNDWTSGKSNLSFTINVEFMFKDNPYDKSYDNTLNFLSFVFVLNNYSYGMYEFGLDYDLENLDVYEFYEKSKDYDYMTFDIYVKNGLWLRDFYQTPTKVGISNVNFFIDRKSAIKFKKNLLNSIKENHKNEIMDIFSLIVADGSEWDNLIKSIKDIRINNLYVDKEKGSLIDKDFINKIFEYPINK